MNANIKQYVRERDEMLKKCSIEELRKFVNEHKKHFTSEYVESFNAAPDKVLEITLHKMIVNAVKLPQNLRERSALWLMFRGYNLGIN